jgi:hypothetical protein
MFDNIKPPCEAFAALGKQGVLAHDCVRGGQADGRGRTTSHGCTVPPPESRTSRTIFAASEINQPSAGGPSKAATIFASGRLAPAPSQSLT